MRLVLSPQQYQLMLFYGFHYKHSIHICKAVLSAPSHEFFYYIYIAVSIASIFVINYRHYFSLLYFSFSTNIICCAYSVDIH